MKLVVIQSLLSPYRYPLFDVLSYVYDLEVWFMGRSVKNRIWDGSDIKYHVFKHKFLQGLTINIGKDDNYPFWINSGIPLMLVKAKPDVLVLFGWDSLTSFLAVFFRFLYHKTKIVLFSESTKYETSWRRFVTKPLVKMLLQKVDYCLAAGKRSEDYLMSLGVPKDKIGIAPTTNDVDRYVFLKDKFSKQRHATRTNLGYRKEDIVIMFYGQLIKRKGVDVLLKAYKELVKNNNLAKLLIIGDGKARTDLNEYIKSHGIAGVKILPNPGDFEINKYYASSDIFVLPSRNDTWGLVVNEAMCAGLPVIVSNMVGSGSELVNKGVNGFIFKSEDVEELKSYLEKLISSKELRSKFGKMSSTMIQNFRPENTLKGYIDAIKKVTKINYGQQYNLKFLNKPKKGLVSVVIPVYSDPSGLTVTLESLGAKKVGLDNIEIIVVNDGGNSQVSEVLKKFEVKEVVLQQRKGSYGARNAGVEISSGEKILFIDAGVIASKNWVKKNSENLNNFDYVCGPINITHQKGWLGVYEANREFPVKEFLDDLHFAPTANLGVTRRVLENCGGFDARLESSGDYEFGNRLYFQGGYSQFYDAETVVFHGPRSWREMFSKHRRLAKGFRDLSRYYPERFFGGRLAIYKLVLKAFTPPFWLFSKKSWKILNSKKKLQVFLVTYLFSAYQHLYTAKLTFQKETNP